MSEDGAGGHDAGGHDAGEDGTGEDGTGEVALEVAVEVEETSPPEQAAAAHAHVRTGRTRGKVALTVSG